MAKKSSPNSKRSSFPSPFFSGFNLPITIIFLQEGNMQKNEGNSAKSRNGADLNALIKGLLEEALNKKSITAYRYEPRYNFPTYQETQFSPDFEITLSNGQIIIIDNTTTARHDRFKQKQWDANGVKEHFKAKGKSVKYYILLPNDDTIGNDKSRAKEIKNVKNERLKIHKKGYYSQVDDLIQVKDLMKMIKS